MNEIVRAIGDTMLTESQHRSIAPALIMCGGGLIVMLVASAVPYAYRAARTLFGRRAAVKF